MRSIGHLVLGLSIGASALMEAGLAAFLVWIGIITPVLDTSVDVPVRSTVTIGLMAIGLGGAAWVSVGALISVVVAGKEPMSWRQIVALTLVASPSVLFAGVVLI